ncbi:MAG: hypothetical protein LBQ15_03540, partial [Clostridium sp.]|nr:hypothetical protein [Clostridium sp.]
MRLSREELLKKCFTSWNEKKHDIVRVLHGDDPMVCWNKEYYEGWYCTLTGSLANTEAVEAYMWHVNGDYNIFRTLVGDVYITAEGKMLGGGIHLKHRGMIYNVHLGLMYGARALDILGISHTGVKGFSNKDGLGSPASKMNTKELDAETAEKVFATDLRDFGESIRKFMGEAVKLWN